MKHTPGPWHWIKQAGTDLLVGGERSTIILDDACCNPQDMALIASAPDLLAACKRAKDFLDKSGLDWLGKGPDPLEAAIAKAEGK